MYFYFLIVLLLFNCNIRRSCQVCSYVFKCISLRINCVCSYNANTHTSSAVHFMGTTPP